MKKMILFTAAMLVSAGMAVSPASAHGMNPCNPCSMKGHHHTMMNPCNPCSMKMHHNMKGHNPCSMQGHNPCSMKGHNPCSMKGHAMNPCNPCSMR